MAVATVAASTTVRGGLRSSTTVDVRPLRAALAMVVPVALLLPALPVDPVPPCPLRALTGVPCPLCGSTRGLVAALHGDVGRAVTLNPASVAVILLATTLLVCWRVRRVTVPVWAVLAVFAALWCYQLFKYTTGRPL